MRNRTPQLAVTTLTVVLAMTCAEAHAVTLADLQQYYTFDSTATPGNDDSGNGLHATSISSTQVNDPVRGMAMEFNGADVINAPSTPLPGAGFTVALWVQRDGVNQGGGNDGLFVFRDPANGNKRISGWVASDDDIWGRLHQSSGGSVNLPQVPATSGGAELIDDQWMHVVYRGDGSTYEVFLDGASTVTGVAYNGTVEPVTLLDIGRQGGESWRGRLDDFGAFSTALTDVEIESIHSLATEPTLQYDLGEATTLLDAFAQSLPEVTVDNVTWSLVSDGSLTGNVGELSTSFIGGLPALSLNLGGGNGLAVQPVPEPSTGMLLLGGIGVLVARRRRRSRA